MPYCNRNTPCFRREYSVAALKALEYKKEDRPQSVCPPSGYNDYAASLALSIASHFAVIVGLGTVR